MAVVNLALAEVERRFIPLSDMTSERPLCEGCGPSTFKRCIFIYGRTDAEGSCWRLCATCAADLYKEKLAEKTDPPRTARARRMPRSKRAGIAGLISASQAAVLVFRTAVTIRNWHKWGWLPGEAHGAFVYYREADVLKARDQADINIDTARHRPRSSWYGSIRHT